MPPLPIERMPMLWMQRNNLRKVFHTEKSKEAVCRPIAAIGSGQGRIGISKRGGGDHT